MFAFVTYAGAQKWIPHGKHKYILHVLVDKQKRPFQLKHIIKDVLVEQVKQICIGETYLLVLTRTMIFLYL